MKKEWGFEGVPEAADWEIFAKSILLCADGDGRLTDAERQWVVGFAAAHGAPDAFVEELRTWKPLGDHKERLESRETGKKSGRGLIYCTIRACSADGKLRPDERATVKKAAARLGIPENVVERIEALIHEEDEARKKSLELLYDAGSPF